MSPGAPDVSRADHLLAAQVAAEAGRALLDYRATLQDTATGLDPSGGEPDRVSNDLIIELLSSRLSLGDALLSEETSDDEGRLAADRTWIVDPLDGTREYWEESRVDWAVHVALALDTRPAAGAVCLPAMGEVWSTADSPALGASNGSNLILVSRTRPPPVAEWVAEQLGAGILGMGSAGAKAMSVLKGDADVYLHAGGQYEWDSCAPVAVALASGLHASRLDGSPLRYNQRNPYLPDLLICRPEIAEQVLAAVAVFSREAKIG